MLKVGERILCSAREALTFMRGKDNGCVSNVPDGEGKLVHRIWDELCEIWVRQAPEE
jgi:hypothetical protein